MILVSGKFETYYFFEFSGWGYSQQLNVQHSRHKFKNWVVVQFARKLARREEKKFISQYLPLPVILRLREAYAGAEALVLVA